MFVRTTAFAATIMLLSITSTSAADHPDKTHDDWIEQLASPSYHARRSAQETLLTLPGAIESLRRVADHSSFEISTASRELIAMIDQRRRDEQLAALTNPTSSMNRIDLPGWDRFSRLVGDDRVARVAFAKITNAYPRGITDLNRFADWIADAGATKLDAYALTANDHVRWAMLIWLDIVDRGNGNHRLSPRIENALSNPSMGPVGCNDGNRTEETDEIVRRLIGRWIETQSHAPSTRSHLRIAMRYGCHDQAGRLCQLTLATTSSAAAEVAAMLTASVLSSHDDCSLAEEIDAELWRRIHDGRTAHVWQMIASRKSKIRTQVGDVALALLLHRHGIDPRDVGYTELLADPVFMFQDCSLGFPDETARQATRALAFERLGVSR